MRKLILVLLVMPFGANADLIDVAGAGELDGKWEITLHEGTLTSMIDELQSQVWWGDTFIDYDLAVIFADALGSVAGVNNFGLGLGPLFAYHDIGTSFFFGAYSDGTSFDPGASAFQSTDVFYSDTFVFATATRVPEPGTLALLGIGLFGMGLARRRIA